jgi:hypothetical protein
MLSSSLRPGLISLRHAYRHAPHLAGAARAARASGARIPGAQRFYADGVKPPDGAAVAARGDKATSADADKDADIENTGPPPLPLLRRPLGVPEKPTARVQTLDERSKELIFDDGKRMEQRRHLCALC